MSIIDKILKPKKTKKVEDAATEAMVDSIQPEVKKANPWPRPHHHPVCTCHKCIRWKEAENAK
jgi:hypothetical protein